MKAHRGQMNDDPIVFAIKDKASLSVAALVFLSLLSLAKASQTDASQSYEYRCAVFAICSVFNSDKYWLSDAVDLALQRTLCSGISILVGTAAGLPLRYLLEKRYIFAFKSKDIAHDGRLFILYTFMGVFTTAIFWGVEYAFHLIFGTDTMRYVGGIIGLAIGFYVKYQLDKNYVFVGGHKKATI